MSAPQDRKPAERTDTNVPAEPLSALETRMAEEEALERAIESGEAATETRRKGRIEAESRRVSDQMTEEARKRKAMPLARMPADQSEPAGAEGQIDHEILMRAASLPKEPALRTILVPLDGSIFAERALPFATVLADMTGAAIVLAQVVRPSPPHPAGILDRVVEGITSEPPAYSAVHATGYLTTFRDQLRNKIEHVSIELKTAASPGRGLEELAERVSADIVILATHARQGIEQRVLGNVGDWLVKHVNAPIFLVPPLLSVNTARQPTLRRLLLPLDGSILAEQVIGLALTVLRRDAAREETGVTRELCLLHVAENFTTVHDGHEYLNDLKKALEIHGLPAGTQVRTAVEIGSAAAVITAYAQYGMEAPSEDAVPYDAIVMATHGRGGLGRWIYGSVAQGIVPRATVPVLMVHPLDVDM